MASVGEGARRTVDGAIFGGIGAALLIGPFALGTADWTTVLFGLGLIGYAAYIIFTHGTYWVSYTLYALIILAAIILVYVAVS